MSGAVVIFILINRVGNNHTNINQLLILSKKKQKYFFPHSEFLLQFFRYRKVEKMKNFLVILAFYKKCSLGRDPLKRTGSKAFLKEVNYYRKKFFFITIFLLKKMSVRKS